MFANHPASIPRPLRDAGVRSYAPISRDLQTRPPVSAEVGMSSVRETASGKQAREELGPTTQERESPSHLNRFGTVAMSARGRATGTE